MSTSTPDAGPTEAERSDDLDYIDAIVHLAARVTALQAANVRLSGEIADAARQVAIEEFRADQGEAERDRLRKERDRLREVADEAIGLLERLGYWGLDRSKEAEVHATALGLRARLAAVDQMGAQTGLSASVSQDRP